MLRYIYCVVLCTFEETLKTLVKSSKASHVVNAYEFSRSVLYRSRPFVCFSFVYSVNFK